MNLESLYKLSQKNKKLAVGLMSGTSLDGVDAVLCRIERNGVNTKITQQKFITYPFPNGLKNLLLKNSSPNGGNVTEICRLNFIIARIYADAVKDLCRKSKAKLSEIDFIGSHGQTIHHLPQKKKLFEINSSSTLQIGDPCVIAKLTGLLTIGDFRVADVALDGEGAPLVPYFDFIMFHSNEKNRVLLNIGGISNFTILNKSGEAKDVIAFDVGPGNMMIDILTKKFFKIDYDQGGKIALSGKMNEQLFNALIEKDSFIEHKPPKSTGREYYGKEFLSPLFRKYRKILPDDWISTLTKFTAYSVYRNYELFIKNETEIEELFISGGGARNKAIINELKNYFGKKVEIKSLGALGFSADAKEAICFAVLANETISGNPTNIPRVTGASKATILGKICLP